MNYKNDLSFIIPCHNLEDYICSLLDSFLRLDTTGLKVEYIFVLDNCDDNTQGKIQKRMRNLPYKIILCNVQDPGLARNVGLDIATGEYIWFVDGDDWLLQTSFLQSLFDIMKENNFPIVRMKYDSNEKNFINKNLKTVWEYIIKKDFIKDLRFDKVDEKGGGEDNRFINALLKQNNYNEQDIPYCNDSYYYYYNYYRYGSIMSNVLKIYS